MCPGFLFMAEGHEAICPMAERAYDRDTDRRPGGIGTGKLLLIAATIEPMKYIIDSFSFNRACQGVKRSQVIGLSCIH
jgi:hypothetical protein